MLLDPLAVEVPQQTLGTDVEFEGVALHRGCKGRMIVRPAPKNHGIVFKRIDLEVDDPFIPGKWDYVSDTALCTTISNSLGVSVSTIEHLMAAFAGCGIDNALIEINCPEVPIMDGSSEPFVNEFERVGTVKQDALRRSLRVIKPVKIVNEDAHIALMPANTFSIEFEIDFNSEAIQEKSLEISLINGTFNHHISRARTFGFLEDVDRMRAAGLGLGGSLHNVVVVDGAQILNDDGLRFKDEFVRHKILDCVGDLYLSGGPIIGRVTAYRTGHYFNNMLLRELFANEGAWEWVTDSTDLSPKKNEANLTFS
ncbi:MAG: UDP-3-O-[3-hydroxymyristoyl] N-acetylglucosamine deacetylase [Rhodospirillaceae bacterium]|nr:UDP-3-O-[3-hydroxymyristoyl] N-acetylglucosamine deacetylase [Rhodospirillaceae bacterium]